MSKARQLADLGNAYDDGALSNRNLIINGAMQVAQRGTVTSSTSGYGGPDRFFCTRQPTGLETEVSQVLDAPSGFEYSYQFKTTVARTGTASDEYTGVSYRSETSSTIPFFWSGGDYVTFSFWAKSSISGTFACNLNLDETNSGGSGDRILYHSLFTINSANTWEKTTIKIPLSFLSSYALRSGYDGTGFGLEITWVLDVSSGGSRDSTTLGWNDPLAEARNYVTSGSGSDTGFFSTVGATFQLTGVQLEVGDTATPFEHRSYGQELALCQRYYEKFAEGRCDYAQVYGTAGQVVQSGRFGIEKRATPTITATGNPTTSGSTFSNGYTLGSIVGTSSSSSKSYSIIWASSDSGRSPGDVTTLSFNSTNYLEFDAEL